MIGYIKKTTQSTGRKGYCIILYEKGNTLSIDMVCKDAAKDVLKAIQNGSTNVSTDVEVIDE